MTKRGRSEEFSLSEAQLQKLWAECHELKDKIIVGCAGYMGMRVSEIAHFNTRWIREGRIYIPSRQECNCWGCSKRGYWKPKSPAGVRAIPIPAFFKPVVIEFLSYQPEGLKMTRQAIDYRIKQLAKKAKLPHTFCHSLRASYVSLLAAKGMEAPAIARLIGHARIDVLQSYLNMKRAEEAAFKGIKQIFG